MKLLPLIILVIALPFGAIAQSSDDVKITQIRDNLHMLVSPMGGNVLVSSGEDGVFIIDDQLVGRSQVVADAIKTLSEHSVKFILNTHYHFDHSGGNEYFGEKNAIIMAHDNVRERLSERQFITYFKKEMLPLSEAGLPVVTFEQSMTLHYNGDSIAITHIPAAHTDGDAVVKFKQHNVIGAGDLIFNGIYPFIDTEHGGSIKGLIAGLDTLIAWADDETIIVPGHGSLMNVGDVQIYRDALNSIAMNVEMSIKAGKTLEQTIADKPTQVFDDTMGKGFIPPDAFVTVVYNDLSGGN